MRRFREDGDQIAVIPDGVNGERGLKKPLPDSGQQLFVHIPFQVTTAPLYRSANRYHFA
jgi:hypothetical protein